MSINKRITLFFSVFLLVSFSSACANSENEQDDKEVNEGVQIDLEAPDDFDFSLNYGPYGIQKVDTFEDIVIKDLVENGVAEANISLSTNEMNRIYSEMIKIDIMQIREGETVDDGVECVSEPPLVTEWTVQMNDETNSFSFDVACEESEVVSDLKELEWLIHEMVASKDEYKELPEPVGFYE